jgi:hypothetical protein
VHEAVTEHEGRRLQPVTEHVMSRRMPDVVKIVADDNALLFEDDE